jgi:hypothetical protein
MGGNMYDLTFAGVARQDRRDHATGTAGHRVRLFSRGNTANNNDTVPCRSPADRRRGGANCGRMHGSTLRLAI